MASKQWRLIVMLVFKYLQAPLLGAFYGGLIGGLWGRSLFDPTTAVWVVPMFMGASVGAVYGLLPEFWRHCGRLACSAAGLYLGALLRAALSPGEPGGWGLLLMLVGMSAGWEIGGKKPFQEQQRGRRILNAALLVGFLGGLALNFFLAVPLFEGSKLPVLIREAPGVILCGLAGGWLGARRS